MQLKVEHLTKTYKKTDALKNVSFTLNGPKIYGLLGRNGAGKTTFMDILAGLQLPTSGTVKVDGEIPFNNRSITKNICMIKEGDNFQKEMKVKDIFKTCSILYDYWDEQLVHDLVKLYKLPIKKRLKTYSKGMSSAVGIIVGLASNAPITIFDEPYIGLDAAGRKRFYNILLEQYEKNERMIIFSTHLIDEVSLLFEEVLILQEGELMLHEQAETLRNSAFVITGDVEEVKHFIANKHVMETKQIANMMTASIYGNKEDAIKAGFRVEGIPIQDLMIYLTDTEKGA